MDEVQFYWVPTLDGAGGVRTLDRGRGIYFGWGEEVLTLDGGRRYLPIEREGYPPWTGKEGYLPWTEGRRYLRWTGGGVPTLEADGGTSPPPPRVD